MPDRYLVDWSAEWDSTPGDVPNLARLDVRKDVERFCALLGSSGPPSTESVAGSAIPAGDRTPWLTLVLGSECLEIGAPTLGLDRFTASVEKEIRERLKDDDSVARVSTFARSLLADRYPGDVAVESDEGGRSPADVAVETGEEGQQSGQLQRPSFKQWEAILLDASALLNQTYYRAMTAQRGAISRWGERRVGLKQTYPPKTPLDPAQGREIDLLCTRLTQLEDLVEGKVRALVQRVLSGVDSQEPKVTVLDLRAMTELAWQLLMKREASAQGWPELLIALSVHHAARGVPLGQPRPRFRQPGAVVKGMRDVLLPMTQNSIEHLYDDEVTVREAAYREYARLLNMEAKVRNREIGSRYGSSSDDFELGDPVTDDELQGLLEGDVPAEPPPASAIVTTFDVQLELALARYFPGQPFVVAVPVDVMAEVDGKRRAKGLWMAYVVRPPAKEDQAALATSILKPPASRWFVLSGANLVDPPRNDDLDSEDLPPLLGMPFIVRLTGSPLVDLPNFQRDRPRLWQALKSKAFMPDQADIQDAEVRIDNPDLSHAVMLEENQALRWSLPELVQSSRRGLPPALTGANDQFWRYWTLVGVQLSDSVVRYRLMAELVAAGLLQSNPAAYRWPSSSGLAVNRAHVGIRAAETLLWSEFDVVKDDCANLTERIKHYTDHLEQALDSGRVGNWPRKDSECELE